MKNSIRLVLVSTLLALSAARAWALLSISPIDGAVVRGIVLVSAATSSPDSSAEFLVDGVLVARAALPSSPPYQANFSWDSRSKANGSHRLTVRFSPSGQSVSSTVNVSNASFTPSPGTITVQ